VRSEVAVAKKRVEENASRAEEPQQRQHYNVTPQQFITAWQTSSSADEVAARLGMPKAIVLARASGYRQEGIRLKKMVRKNSKALNVAELNKLIEEIKKRGEG
jgi:hypothetical protein